ncbi:MAG TPA: type II secretion system protein GspL [Candidatus Binatia bacterium]|nr:type II secretion system protein GspL [Candidatus Binatia bacterium]
MPNRILALDPHGAQLAAVIVETSFRSYQIVGYYSEPRDPSVPLGAQLRTFVSRYSMAADTVLSALPGDAAVYRFLELPFRDWRKLQQTVPFELESQVPFAVDDAIVDFQVIDKTANGARVFAALAPKSRIEDHLKALAEAGLDPAVVDFAPLTTLNVLQLFEGDRPERYAFLHVSAARGTLAIYRGGRLENLRVIDVAGEPPVPAFVREIVWSLKSLNGGPPSGDEVELRGMLIGGSSGPELLDSLRSRVDLTIQRLEDLPLRHVPAALHGRQGTFAPALGLALREIADAPTLGLNFRRESFSYRRGQEEMQGVLTRLGVLGAVVLALFALWQGVSYYQLSSQYDELRNIVRQAFHEALPNTPVVDEAEQLQQEIKKLQKQQQQLGFGPTGPVSPLEILRQISERAPTEPRINVDELAIDPDGVHLRAKTASFEAVETIRKKIAESPLFGEVQVKEPRTTTDGKVEFRMNLLFGKGAEG